MVEERTLGLVRATETPGGLKELDHDSSKDQLQQEMEATRESISNTVDEIKDTVVNSYESVKESVSQTLDWHEQVKKRPVAWGAGALGVGFIVGYGVAAVVKGPTKISVSRYEEDAIDPSYEDRPMTQPLATSPGNGGRERRPHQESGVGLMQRIKETPAFDRVKSEAGVIGNQFVNEISKKAQDVVLPAAVAWIGSWLEGLVPAKSTGQKASVPPAAAGG
ncbi:MAG TPA: hypothetical protein VFX97_14320 [Pyrinomonadaceae bacterium]|nr:hypothetical protein [Pyrinomonadaceae bacterium]